MIEVGCFNCIHKETACGEISGRGDCLDSGVCEFSGNTRCDNFQYKHWQPEPQFEEGDWVRVVGLDEHNDFGVADEFNNKVGKVTDVGNGTSYRVEIPDITFGQQVHVCNLEKAEPLDIFEHYGQSIVIDMSDVMEMDPYRELQRVLMLAYDQAKFGKGKERHVQTDAEPFHEQQIVEYAKRVGPSGPAYQVLKKITEALSLPKERALAEILGAINYAVGMYLTIESKPE